MASWVDVALTAEDDHRTGLVLEHVAHVPDEMWEEYGPGATGIGWDLGLVGLDRRLWTGAAVDPAEAETVISPVAWTRRSRAAGSAR